MRTLLIPLLLLFAIPAQAADKAIVPSWGVNPVTYCVAQQPTIPAKRVVSGALYEAFESWSDVCDLRFEEVKDPADANIVIRFDPTVIGGKSQFPPEPLYTGQITLWLNGATNYNERGRAYLQQLGGHEIGHAIGLFRHSDRTDQLMSVTVIGVMVPQWEDVQRAVRIYGER